MKLLRFLFLLVPFFGLWFAATGGAGAGSGGDDDDGGDDGGSGSGSGGEHAASFDNLVSRHNSDMRAVAELLYRENYEYRSRNRDLHQKVEDLTGKVPAEGAVILEGDKANLLTSYQALGTPEEIQTLQGEHRTLRRDGVLRDAAKAHGYKFTVLKRLAGELEIELGEMDAGEGKKKSAAYVVDGDKKTLLDEYAGEEWADFSQALSAEPPRDSGIPYFKQSSGGQGAPVDAATAYINKMYKSKET